MQLPQLNPPTRLSSSDQAYELIMSAILDGILIAGTPLKLDELAKNLNMSMMPVREALRRLEAAGLVISEAYKGARVAAVSMDDLEDTYLTRILLEGLLVQMAARVITPSEIKSAELALEEQQKAIHLGDHAGSRHWHGEFHFALYRAASASWLLRSVEAPWTNSERYRNAAGFARQTRMNEAYDEHKELLDACASRDPARARDALRVHLLHTVSSIDSSAGERVAHKVAQCNE